MITPQELKRYEEEISPYPLGNGDPPLPGQFLPRIREELTKDQSIAVEVLKEHVSFLQGQLKERDSYWMNRALELEKELDRLRRENTKLKVGIGEMTRYICESDSAHENEYGFATVHPDDYKGWCALADLEIHD